VVATPQRSAPRSEGSRWVTDVEAAFPLTKEPIARVLIEGAVRSQPSKLCAFRLENISIPREGLFAPSQGLILGQARGGSTLSLLAQGPCRLATRVQIAGQPVPEGQLWFGVSHQSNEGWEPIDWRPGSAAQNGVFQVAGLRPGLCRVLRVFQPRTAWAGSGAWVESESLVRLVPEKETMMSPLRWIARDRPRNANAPRRRATEGKGLLRRPHQ
jgi:hypothetical protein